MSGAPGFLLFLALGIVLVSLILGAAFSSPALLLLALPSVSVLRARTHVKPPPPPAQWRGIPVYKVGE